MMMTTNLRLAAFLLGGLLLCPLARGGDWPQWRHDAARGNSTPHALPAQLHLQWVRQLPPPRPAWPAEQKRLQFDVVPQPVVLGKRIFVPSTGNDGVTAYDTQTGRELWHCWAEGPVRLAPVAHRDRVYFTADDGCLYCVNAADGKRCWRVQGGPARRWVIGNHRLVSSWPARGGPVLHQGKVFFAAGIWPFMGIFLHAVDPDTGEIVWTNSGDGTNFIIHPHGAPAFGGVAPNGHLVANGNFLIVPGGRSTPAVFDTRKGKLLHFAFDGRNGGCQVLAGRRLYYVGGKAYLAEDGTPLGFADPALLDDQMVLSLDKGETILGESPDPKIKETVKLDRKGKEVHSKAIKARKLFEIGLEDSAGDVLLRAGNRLFTGGVGAITAFDLGAHPTDGARKAVWSTHIGSEVHHMLAADDRLFVVTTDARLYCFGAKHVQPPFHALTARPLPRRRDSWTERAAAILKATDSSHGFAVALGLGSGRLAEELLQQSQLHVIVVDSDAARVDAFRRRMRAAGFYGKRVAVHIGDPARFALPPYLANLIVAEEPGTLGMHNDREAARRIFQALRPYGGQLCLEKGDAARFLESSCVPFFAQARVRKTGNFTLLVRDGPLPGSDYWTHQYGSAAKTGVSRDKLVKAPLGLLWFGGPSHQGILPRHGHGPSPQVAGGRLFIEGANLLRAVDVYTGRLLWERKLKEFGKYYNTTWHFPGANEIGSNYVSLPDRVYAVHGSAILELDAATGGTLRMFRLPAVAGKEAPPFGFLAVSGDSLIATAEPVPINLPIPFKLRLKDTDDDNTPAPGKGKCGDESGSDESNEEPASEQTPEWPTGKYASGSRRLVVFDRRTGKLRWSQDAEFTFRHNAIAVGAGRIYCIDGITEDQKKMLARRGLTFSGRPTLLALDARTGNVLWRKLEPVFGTFLNYSEEHDILLQGGSTYRDRAGDEVKKGLAGFRGNSGDLLWHQPTLTYGGPCLLWHDKIITNGLGGFALDLRTGQKTGWKYERKYGCNTALGREHLLTFRSGCAGFYDLENLSGTGNLGGFRSSCTTNLIVADGVLNAPDYTRTCTCTYQNQCSLALIHDPAAEFWTFGGITNPDRLGLNFGAPGDRRAPDGTLWQAKSKAKFEPADLQVFRLHSSLVSGAEPTWVTASGIFGATRITIPVNGGNAFRVKLYFLEPDKIAAGQRVFDVKIQGKTMLANLDILQAAGGSRRGVVREFTIHVRENAIVVELHAHSALPTAISGVEIIRE
jgi:outer membrane protein assembly factor BamB